MIKMIVVPYQFHMIAVPVVFFLVSLVQFKRHKLKRDEVGSKFIILNALTYAYLIEVSIILLGIFHSELLATIIIYTPSLPAILYVFSATTKTITTQERSIKEKSKRLKKIIDKSANTSITVSNIATELVSSTSEMNATSEQVSTTTQNVAHQAQIQAQFLHDVNKMSTDINKITKTLVYLSEQTNLLALNASIEAGRAGEFGAGFSVVAEKVQKLAEESRNSVGETSTITQKMKDYLQTAADEISKVSMAMEEISSSMQEQTSAMEEIAATATKLEEISQSLKSELVIKN